MKITERQLAFLQDYVWQKKSNFDTEARLELVDHLVCDFEENGNGNISEFLANKNTFILNYKKNREREIHWAYQRELWRTFFGFFTNVKTIPIIFFLVVFFYQLIDLFSEKVVSIAFIAIIIAPTILGLVKTYHKKREIRNLIEFKYLANVMALPHMFLYSLNLFKEFLFSNKFLVLTYLCAGVMLNFAGIILILKKRKRILSKYDYLL